ncbi:MAG: biotin transporter BioY [Planctomycetota bacterium]
MPRGSLADLARPSAMPQAILYDLTLALGGSLCVALLAQIAIPITGSPVPVTGQTLGVLLVGATLGSTRGMLSLLFYLAEGSLGLPVFAGGGVFVPATAGYLVGFVAAAGCVGTLTERGWDRHVGSTLLAMMLGTLCIFACGILYLSTQLGWSAALAQGFTPFIPGAFIKITLAGLLLPTIWRLLRIPRSL